MRTAIIILAGFALWGASLALARMLSGSSRSFTIATTAFVVVWLFAAAANTWVGVARAGYAFREELPIFLLIFLLPAVVAVAVQWKLL